MSTIEQAQINTVNKYREVTEGILVVKQNDDGDLTLLLSSEVTNNAGQVV